MTIIIYKDEKPIGLNFNGYEIKPRNPSYNIAIDNETNTFSIKDEDNNLNVFKNILKDDFLFDRVNGFFIDLQMDIDFHHEMLDEYIIKIRVKRSNNTVIISFIESFEVRDTSVSNIHYNKYIERYFNIINDNASQILGVKYSIDCSDIPTIDNIFEYEVDINDLSNDIYLEIKSKEKDVRNFLALAKKELNFRTINIYCEGKTDYMHLSSALKYLKSNNKFKFLTVNFCTNAEINGDSQLLTFCKNVCLSEREDIILCIFDDDNPETTRALKAKIHNWGNNVYSLIMPTPPNREEGAFCVELYYNDDILNSKDKNGRKIYLRKDFNVRNGFHVRDNVFFLKSGSKKSLIIDDNVIDKESGDNVALSKTDFAAQIHNKTYPFDKINFDSFEPLFACIEEIKSDKYYKPNQAF